MSKLMTNIGIAIFGTVLSTGMFMLMDVLVGQPPTLTKGLLLTMFGVNMIAVSLYRRNA